MQVSLALRSLFSYGARLRGVLVSFSALTGGTTLALTISSSSSSQIDARQYGGPRLLNGIDGAAPFLLVLILIVSGLLFIAVDICLCLRL